MKYVCKNIQICRSEPSAYEQFASLHYLNGICRGASCFLFKINGEIGAFVSVLAMPMRGCTNALICHRIVVLERFRGLGLSSLIVNLLGGIYKSEGKRLYLKSDSTQMGKMLRNNPLWEPTNMNRRTRKLTPHDKERNKCRHRRAAFSYRYEGPSISGYESIAKRINDIRSRNLLGKYIPVNIQQVAQITYCINPVFLKDALEHDCNWLVNRYSFIYGDKSEQALYTTELQIKRNKINVTPQYAKRLLFINGILRKVQKNYSVEALIYYLLKENYIQKFNLSNVEVIRLGLRIYNTDLSKYSNFIERLKSSFTYKVNAEVAKKRGMSAKAASNVARKEIRLQKFDELYNPALTDEVNIVNMANKGLIISLSTLKRWRKEKGLTKYNKSVITMI